MLLGGPDAFEFIAEHRAVRMAPAEADERLRGLLFRKKGPERIAAHLGLQGTNLLEHVGCFFFVATAVHLAIGLEPATLVDMEESATEFVRLEPLTQRPVAKRIGIFCMELLRFPLSPVLTLAREGCAWGKQARPDENFA